MMTVLPQKINCLTGVCLRVKKTLVIFFDNFIDVSLQRWFPKVSNYLCVLPVIQLLPAAFRFSLPFHCVIILQLQFF